MTGLAFVALEPGRLPEFLGAGHADAPLDAVVGAFFGALIVKHRPHNAVGWLLLITGTTQGLHLLTNEFATRALVYHQRDEPLLVASELGIDVAGGLIEYRRAGGVLRQQLKWFAAVLAALAAVAVCFGAASAASSC